MFIKNKRISLLSYWTSRYVLTLVIGLAVVFLVSVLWIRHTTLEYRLEMMEYMADETVNRITNIGAEHERDIPNFLEQKGRPNFRDIDPVMYITDVSGTVLSSNRRFSPMPTLDFTTLLDTEDVSKVAIEGVQFYIVKRAIEKDDQTLGYIFIVEKKSVLLRSNQEFGQLALLIVTLGLLGWCAIYFLSKRLARPINQVAQAAKLVKDGHYDVDLPAEIREEEIYELVTSFKEMATRLQQLEKTRTELLAGVTHELKTPVTSISGLLQAVQDGVVTGDAADEFIDMALIETTKMKTMVGDLLAFNTFAVDAVPVKISSIDASHCIIDIISRWNATREHIKVRVHPLKTPVDVAVDSVRIQQIVTNILTNAAQAMHETGEIVVTLEARGELIVVLIQDHGPGIPQNEQPFIFERFYRGEQKKFSVRGLGLGLPLSKMMAQSIGGDLQLISSNENGTCFEILLKKAI